MALEGQELLALGCDLVALEGQEELLVLDLVVLEDPECLDLEDLNKDLDLKGQDPRDQDLKDLDHNNRDNPDQLDLRLELKVPDLEGLNRVSDNHVS